MTKPEEIRVLVVDDSAVVRSIIADSVAATPDIKVVGAAGDGLQALDLLDVLRPDVITLDIQMPKMDGLATLEAILARRPVPVIMVSSLTKMGANMTLDALDRGAVDYLEKPDYGSKTRTALREDLPRKIRAAAGLDIRRVLELRRKQRQQREETPRPAPPRRTQRSPRQPDLTGKCVAIGISTGGPPALARLFGDLRPPMPPIVVVQHMPAGFTKALAWRLDALGELSVREAADGDLLAANLVLIAPGGKHLELRRTGGSVKAVVREGAPVSGHVPSVDVLMTSVAETFNKDCLGLIMTGMGRDGVEGCRAIRAAGGCVFGQDEASSEVYGMNKAAYLQGNVDRQFALEDAAAVIARYVQSRWVSESPFDFQVRRSTLAWS